MVVQNPLLENANEPLTRYAMTGMTDEQLRTVGYISVLWNALERNLVAAIWTVARWEQDVGELVTADMGNVSRAGLLMNLVLLRVDDPRLIEQTTVTLSLYDLLRGSRNDLMHGFYNWRHTGPRPQTLAKITAKKRTGAAELKTVPVELAYLEQLTADIHVCNESFNDLYHKLHFRNWWIDGDRGPLAGTYDDAVHGWREPSFETHFVQECLTRRSRLLNPPHNQRQQQPSRPKSERRKRSAE